MPPLTEIVTIQSQALKELNEKLAVLVDQAKLIEIKDPLTRIAAAAVRTGFKSYVEAVRLQTDGEIAEVTERLDRLKQNRATLLQPAKNWMEIIDAKDVAYRTEEKRQAQLEQDRKNAELARQHQEKLDAEQKEAERSAAETQKRKIAEIKHWLDTGKIGKREAARQLKAAGAFAQAAIEDAAAAHEEALAAPPPTVTVKPNIPAVAGAPRNQTRWTFVVVHPELIPLTYRMVDEKAIGSMVRDVKDKAKAERQCPGIEVRSEG